MVQYWSFYCGVQFFLLLWCSSAVVHNIFGVLIHSFTLSKLWKPYLAVLITFEIKICISYPKVSSGSPFFPFFFSLPLFWSPMPMIFIQALPLPPLAIFADVWTGLRDKAYGKRFLGQGFQTLFSWHTVLINRFQLKSGWCGRIQVIQVWQGTWIILDGTGCLDRIALSRKACIGFPGAGCLD